jgi:hypothetical protein
MFQKASVLLRSRVFHFTLFGILFMILGVSVAAIAGNSRIPTVQAASSFQKPEAPASYAWRVSPCTISEIMLGNERIHVRCSMDDPIGIYYFAIQTDAAYQLKANRILTILNTGYVMGKPVEIMYDTDPSHNPSGCNVGDCRLLYQILIRP